MNFEDMMWLFNTDKTRGISRVNIDEAALLWCYAKKIHGTVLEIGTCHGGTTALLLAADCRVITIDLKPKIDKKIKGMLGAFEGLELLIPITADSQDVVLTEEIHMLFIDGDHSYAGCLADVEKHWPLLHKGGVAIFHDAAENDSPGHCVGVASVVKELIQEGRAKKLETVRSMLVLEKLGE